ncbi:MAG: VapE domain-containing protein, partial [Rhodospirillales bacterium]
MKADLAARHAKMLQDDSRITPELIEQRGYYTAAAGNDGYKHLKNLGFNHQQAKTALSGDVLVVPIAPPDRSNSTYMIRPDNPRIKPGKKLADGTREQKVLKYERPPGSPNRLDVPRSCLDRIDDPSVDLFLTEGVKKGDALAAAGLCAASLPGGVYGFLGRNEKDASTVIADLDRVAWRDKMTDEPRRVFVVFDSDVATKRQVKTALKRLAGILRNAGAEVTPVYLPAGPDGEKAGVDDYLANGGTVAGLYQLAGTAQLVQAAMESSRGRVKTAEYLKALAGLGYTFRLNACNDKLEVNGQPMTDGLAAKIRGQMRDAGYEHVNVMQDAYLGHAYDNQYHPIRDYLNGLKYDGGPHIDTLATYFEDAHQNSRLPDHPCPVFHTWLRRWLIGAVAKVFKAEQNPMLVLDGRQDLGKSYFAHWLCPLPDYFIESAIDPADKDSRIRLISYWLWEVAELGATTRRADREALKAFISTRRVTVRAPYGRNDITKPSMASLIGTINNESGFLSDPTGNRRFLTCTLTKINWDYADMDPAGIWAEAVHLYRAGESWRLTKAERELRDSLNQD